MPADRGLDRHSCISSSNRLHRLSGGVEHKSLWFSRTIPRGALFLERADLHFGLDNRLRPAGHVRVAHFGFGDSYLERSRFAGDSCV